MVEFTKKFGQGLRGSAKGNNPVPVSRNTTLL